jgi:hypothetical protein
MARPKSSSGNRRTSAGTGRKLPVFAWCERAAALDRHDERLAYIKREVPADWQDITLATLPHFIVGRITNEPDKAKRNALIEDALAAKHKPAWAKRFIDCMTADVGAGAW